MFKAIAPISLGVALALLPNAVSAQTGTSSSWGSYGTGQQIPTQSLTPRDREWNFDHQAENEAIAGAEWIRQHSRAAQHSSFSFQRSGRLRKRESPELYSVIPPRDLKQIARSQPPIPKAAGFTISRQGAGRPPKAIDPYIDFLPMNG